MPGNLFTNYFLTEGIKATAEWRASISDSTAFAAFRDGVRQRYDALSGSEGPNEAVTEQELIRPVLELLGWADYLPQQGATRNEDVPDYLLFTDAASKERAAGRTNPEERFRDAIVVEESKRFGLPLNARDRDDVRQSRTPHGQILRYLSTADIESDSRIRWGFLTNGGLWRLYDYRALLRGRPRRDTGVRWRGRAPPLLPAVPSRFLPPHSRGHNQLPGSGSSPGEAVRGGGGPGPIQRRIREGLSQAGPSPGRRHRRRSVTRPSRSPHPPLSAALRALCRGPGAASGE